MNKYINAKRKQAGMTLMEIIAALAIISAVVVGALALYNSANSSQTSTQLLKDITSIRLATQQLYQGTGTYGAAATNLVPVLITSNKIPTTLTPSGGTTINTPLGGTLAVVAGTGGLNVVMTLSNVPTDICVALLTSASSGWSSVKVGASAALVTFPVSPATATAAANCGGTAPFSIAWTTVN